MSVTLQTYQAIALEDPEHNWELVRGQLREKPSMSAEHNEITVSLGLALGRQLDRSEYRVRINSSRVRYSEDNYYVPDVLVVPAHLVIMQTRERGGLEYFDVPLPLVVEVWSPSTGNYDVEEKIPLYRERGDLEIWRIHPHERSLTRWVRSPSGDYEQFRHFGGFVDLSALPSVRIDIDALFAFE